MRGRADIRRRSIAALIALAGVAALAFGVTACGGGEGRQDEGLEDATYSVDVLDAAFPEVQRLGKTVDLGLDIENTGEEAIPNLAVTVFVLGEEGENARDAFAYRDPQKNLNRHDRPIWILEPGYPTLRDDPVLGNAGTASARTFAFGELEPGETAEAVWRLTPVRPGSYRLSYVITPDLYGVGEVEAEDGAASGTLSARIRRAPEQLRVDDRGRVVEIEPGTP